MITFKDYNQSPQSIDQVKESWDLRWIKDKKVIRIIDFEERPFSPKYSYVGFERDDIRKEWEVTRGLAIEESVVNKDRTAYEKIIKFPRRKYFYLPMDDNDKYPLSETRIFHGVLLSDFEALDIINAVCKYNRETYREQKKVWFYIDYYPS